MALSKDEITARSLRLSGRAPNPYTGTLNDPFQEAQSTYAGPGWAQFFGGLQKQQEDAQDEGKNFRVGWGGFGNATEDGGGMARGRGPSLAAMSAGDLNPLEEQAQKQLMLQQQANALAEQAKAEKLAQEAGIDAKTEHDNAGLAKSYQDFVLSSAFVPPSPITRTPATVPVGPQQPMAGQPNAGQPTYMARPAAPPTVQQSNLQSVPGTMRPALAEAMQEMALKKQTADAATAKVAEETRHNVAGETLAGGAQVTPDAVDLAARNYLTTGAMPPLGMGDKTTRQKILNKAGELQVGGLGNGSIAANKAIYGGDSSSLKKLQNQRDTIGAFEETAGKNIDLFLDAAGKVVDTGSPLANTPARLVSGKMIGSPDQASYEAARQVAINEVAKITSNPTLSGQLSDSARKEVEAFNPANATLAQSVAVMRTLKKDMGNRTSSLDDQIGLIRGRLGATNGTTAKTSGGTVKLQSPDGKSTMDVSPDQVDHYIKLGAKRVGG